MLAVCEMGHVCVAAQLFSAVGNSSSSLGWQSASGAVQYLALPRGGELRQEQEGANQARGLHD